MKHLFYYSADYQFKEASEMFVKFVHTGWRKFNKDKLLKEIYKVRKSFQEQEDLKRRRFEIQLW